MSNNENISAQEAAYDRHGYASMTFSESHPGRIAATAKLFGLNPPEISSARVLELGCANGGNVIPLAAHYPDASFVGIDLSGVLIEQGAARIAALGLKNIELRKLSITDLGPEDGLFDYIIAHGVYSWLPHEVREAMLAFAGGHLARHGQLYISYNVYPGWHYKNVTRDLMLFHAENVAGGRENVNAARDILTDVAGAPSGALYNAIMHDEYRIASAAKNSYLRAEYLAEINDAVYFRDFIAQTRRHGLEFLSEIEPIWAMPELFPAHVAQTIRRYAGGDRIKLEQYLDFFIGRTFRTSLLVKQDVLEHVDWAIQEQRVDDLHFVLNAQLRESAIPAAAECIRRPFATFHWRGGSVETYDELQTAAMRWILVGEATRSGTFTIADILAAVKPTSNEDADRSQIAQLILPLLKQRLVTPYSEAIRWGRVGEYPKLIDLARIDAQRGAENFASLLHQNIAIYSPHLRALAILLDGTRNENDLAEILRQGHEFGSHDEALIFVRSTLREFEQFKLLAASPE